MTICHEDYLVFMVSPDISNTRAANHQMFIYCISIYAVKYLFYLGIQLNELRISYIWSFDIQ